MATIREVAKGFIPKQVKNIADLPEVSLDFELKESDVKINPAGEEYTYNYIEINGEQYRIPDAVIKQLKDLTEANPNLKKFKVKKSGEGMKTTYTTIPLS